MPWLAGVQGVRQSSRRKTSGKEDLREAKSSWALLTWRASRVGSCNGSGGEGGGVDEVAVGNIDEEVKACKEVGPDERDRDVHDDEPPGEGSVTEGESHRLVPIGDDAGAVGSYQMSIGAWTITAMNHGLWEEGSASTCADEEVETCEGIKHKEHISGDRDHRFKRRPHNSFYGHAHGFSHFLAEYPKRVW